ncbi:MAG: hypothetical protein B7Z80_20860 [Rhodospirillales bacterium 20-64-7]|nr:MAG: hypothetical protein B7Z80_20860 [Rhodospirillales bacterium 20-64-7]HQT77907.1 c-type cytochrome [Rhodopila sp.]
MTQHLKEGGMAKSAMFLAAVLLCTGAVRARAQDQVGDVAAGQALAAQHCVACHAVDRPTRPTQHAPSWQAIADMPSATSLSLHVFLRTSHPTMPNYRLGAKETDDVVAYILSLRQH